MLNVIWCSFWSGVGGGILGYLATDWLYVRIAQYQHKRAVRRWTANRDFCQDLCAGKPQLSERSNTSRLSIHTGFDHDD